MKPLLLGVAVLIGIDWPAGAWAGDVPRGVANPCFWGVAANAPKLRRTAVIGVGKSQSAAVSDARQNAYRQVGSGYTILSQRVFGAGSSWTCELRIQYKE